MNFVNHADLGFKKEAVLLLSANSDSTLVSRLPVFKQQLLQPVMEEIISNRNGD